MVCTPLKKRTPSLWMFLTPSLSSGFMMFGGGKLEWEEEKYLQEAKNLFLRRRIFLFFILGWGAFLLFYWQIKKLLGAVIRKLGEGNEKKISGG